EMHIVSVDDALVRDDVLVAAVKGVDGTALRAANADLAPADAEVHGDLALLPIIRCAEPAGLDLRVSEGGEYARRRHRIGPLDDETGVDDGSLAHRSLLRFGVRVWLSARVVLWHGKKGA